ncbi:MAG TPA: undecaprenyl-diphosphate phosphatase [Anaerolineae bacterium]|nr:undecaprenyl-diphosphate phosphatase [Anaerolineae bacterium]
MTLLQALVLGLVQGATEFLPVSSSGHLVLVPWLFGWEFADIAFHVVLHAGTLLAVVIYFRRDLWALLCAAWHGILQRRPFEDPLSRQAWLLLLASLPAAVAGFLLEDLVSEALETPLAVSVFLLVTAGLLLISERLGRKDRDARSLGVWDALWIGFAQALALFPGISRSGTTIAGGLTRGLRREEATRFSFLLAVPVILGGTVLAMVDFFSTPTAGTQIVPMVVGFLTSAGIGYPAIHLLLVHVRRRPLTGFAVYCLLAGVAGLALSVFRG